MIEYDELFNKIKNSINKNDNFLKDYLKLEVGSIVNCRLLPNINDIENSIYSYNWHSFTSRFDLTTKFSFLCPSTYGEKCPFCDKSIKLWKSSDESKKLLSKIIRRKNSWLVNIYVINDNKNPENNGKVKILQFGFQIYQKIKEAIETPEYGKRIWMLNENGCTFRIKCDKNTEKKDAWPTYNASTFLPPSPIAGMTLELEQKILNSTFKLESKIKRYSYNELLEILNKHFLNFDNENFNENFNELNDNDSSNNNINYNLQNKNNDINNISDDILDEKLDNSVKNSNEDNNKSFSTIDDLELEKWIKDIN